MSALLEPLAHQHDMLLETHRRDGSWVPTPVNPVVEDDHVFFRTWRESGKARRLRNDPTVHFAPSTRSGRPTGRRFNGRATLLRGEDERHAAAMIDRRYPLLQGVAVRTYHRVRGLGTQHYVIEEIAPDPVVTADTRDDERAIRTLLDQWWAATRANDVDAVLDLMTDDVLFLTPGQPPFGKTEFERSARGRSMRITGASVIDEVEVAGSWAWMRTRIDMTMTSVDGEPHQRAGTTLTVLRKESDGRWRLARDANLLTE